MEKEQNEYLLPLVGMYFRPPAEGIVKALTSGQRLYLRPEPTNQYDPYAVQVLVRSGDVREEVVRSVLAMHLMGYGKTLEEFDEEREWHLGYIKKEFARDLQPMLFSEARVEPEAVTSGEVGDETCVDYPCELAFEGEKGKAMVRVRI